ncbi:hypothetical protein MED297_06079 [Reinekea sp. MED297]|uniref:LITAF domain-containing protein n=2 Tax=Reinekea TaxID=230494 RepID=A4BDF0_9GAMM|nr:hypothetical protein MED297_06079 [Reinekea sp. MED297] [Reinekea blandensis MED297]
MYPDMNNSAHQFRCPGCGALLDRFWHVGRTWRDFYLVICLVFLVTIIVVALL